MALTNQITVLTQYIVDRLTTSKTSLGLKDIFYGDQELIPRYPAVAVDSVSKERELAGLPFRTDNNFTILLLVYHAQISNTAVTRKSCDEFAEAIELNLHDDTTMGGNVIHGYVTMMESGFAVRGGSQLRATRITWSGYSKTNIG